VRVDCNTFPGKIWCVWHAPRCARLAGVLWVDDETHTYCVVDFPVRIENVGVAVRIEQAGQIVINVGASLILIDPIEGESDAPITVAVALAAEA
jgi:hypothetical protein